jgi:hypothetical protein
MHLHYGADGIEDSEFLKTLVKASKKAHEPVAKALKS